MAITVKLNDMTVTVGGDFQSALAFVKSFNGRRFDAATKIFRKSHVGFLDMRARFVMFPSFRKIENNVAINTYTLNGAICHEDEMISI
jgi:hypothetical protein